MREANSEVKVPPKKKQKVAVMTPPSSEAMTTKKNKNRKKKTKAIPLNERKGRNFDAARTDCLSLAVSEKKAWKKLKAYCHKDPHLDCPILPATMSKSLPKVLVIICKHFPGDNHFDEMTEDGLL